MRTRRLGFARWALIAALLSGACASGEFRPVAGPTAPRPVWLPEDTWSYKGQTPTSTYTYQQTVAGEGVFEGRPAYDVRTGYYRSWVTKDLGVMVRMAGDQVVRRVTPPSDWDWPLVVGKSWSRDVEWQDLSQTRQRYFYTDVWTVEAHETVTVEAGTFQAFKVVRRVQDGTAYDEYWYVPEVKWTVRSRGAGAVAPTSYEEELTSYKVK